jgi:hypothetical protein
MPKLLLSLLILLVLDASAQFEKGDHTLLVSYGNMRMDQDVYTEINLDFEYQIFDRFTIGYSFGVGKRINDDKYHIHFPGGPILTGAMWAYAAPVLDNISFDGIAVAFMTSVIITAIPEKISVDFFARNNRLKISPFLRYLAFDYIDEEGGVFNKLFYRMGIGLDLRFVDHSNRFVMGGGFSYRNITSIDDGVNLDVKVGLILDHKERKKPRIDWMELGYD